MICIAITAKEESTRPARTFMSLSLPVILLDSLNCSRVLINNVQDAYIATNYLIDCCNKQPGICVPPTGYKIPDNVAIIGCDNILEGQITEPSLTTIDIPREFMGQTAARQLIYQITNPAACPVKIEVSTKRTKKFTV